VEINLLARETINGERIAMAKNLVKIIYTSILFQ